MEVANETFDALKASSNQMLKVVVRSYDYVSVEDKDAPPEVIGDIARMAIDLLEGTATAFTDEKIDLSQVGHILGVVNIFIFNHSNPDGEKFDTTFPVDLAIRIIRESKIDNLRTLLGGILIGSESHLIRRDGVKELLNIPNPETVDINSMRTFFTGLLMGSGGKLLGNEEVKRLLML